MASFRKCSNGANMSFRKKVKTVLKDLQRHSILLFRPKKDPLKNKNFCSFEVEVLKGFFIDIKVYRTTNISGCSFAESHAKSFKILVSDDCRLKEIKKIIHELVFSAKKGPLTERAFLKDVKVIISKKLLPIVKIEHSSESNDMNEHFDYIIDYKMKKKDRSRIKIDLKSSLANSRAAFVHGKLNSRVSYRVGMPLEELVIKLKQICEDSIVRNYNSNRI